MLSQTEGSYSDPNPKTVPIDNTPTNTGEIPILLRFEIVKINSDGNPITNRESGNNDLGLFVGSVINLVYREYRQGKSEDPTYVYSPGRAVDLKAEKEGSNDVRYTILVPLSNSNKDNTVISFPSDKFTDTNEISELFNFLVKGSTLSYGDEVQSAINNLSFIVEKNIPWLSDEVSPIQ